ncbi:MAG: hypothetical protein WC663_01635 [Patescibacteria group bacterium]|jgi:hypothetical protein
MNRREIEIARASFSDDCRRIRENTIKPIPLHWKTDEIVKNYQRFPWLPSCLSFSAICFSIAVFVFGDSTFALLITAISLILGIVALTNAFSGYCKNWKLTPEIKFHLELAEKVAQLNAKIERHNTLYLRSLHNPEMQTNLAIIKGDILKAQERMSRIYQAVPLVNEANALSALDDPTAIPAQEIQALQDDLERTRLLLEAYDELR